LHLHYCAVILTCPPERSEGPLQLAGGKAPTDSPLGFDIFD
jgi:hypothetical protein